jgi:hypothetical protein
LRGLEDTALVDFASRLFGVPAQKVELVRDERFQPAADERYVPPEPVEAREFRAVDRVDPQLGGSG